MNMTRLMMNPKKAVWPWTDWTLILSLLLILVRNQYVQLSGYPVMFARLAQKVLVVFAILMPVKVKNMILGGGVLRAEEEPGMS